MTKPQIFAHSWLPEDVRERLDQKFLLDVHNSFERILSGEELIARVKGVNGIIVQGPIIDLPLINSCSGTLKIVSNVAVGVDNISVDECTANKIIVTNTPDILTDAVADLSMGLLLSVARRIPEGERMVRQDKFQGNPFPLLWGSDLKGEVLGIIGMGRIGQALAKRALPFGLDIKYYSRNRVGENIENELRAEWLNLNELLSRSKFIVILCPLTSETKHLIAKDELELMRSDSFLINVARGPIVKESDLVSALKNKLIAGCALDVYEFEPKYDKDLAGMDNVVLTPHAGSASVGARTGMVKLAAHNIETYFKNGKVPNAVNPEIL